jgi:hypothetical protein
VLYHKTIALTYRRQWNTNESDREGHLLVGTEKIHEDINSGYNPSRDSNRTFLEYNTKELTASSILFGVYLLKKQPYSPYGSVTTIFTVMTQKI